MRDTGRERNIRKDRMCNGSGDVTDRCEFPVSSEYIVELKK